MTAQAARLPFARSSAKLDITVHEGLSQAVRDFWLNLLATLRNPTLFQHPAWHEAFFAGHYRAEQYGKLLFVTVAQEGNPVALVPLSHHETRRFGLPARIVSLMFPTDMGVRDLAVGDGIDGGELLHAVLTQALPQAGYGWDMAEFNDVVENSTAWAAFERLPHLRKLSTHHHDSNRLKCGDSLANSYAHLSKSHIKKTKRKRKSFDALGQVTCELLTEPAEMRAALDAYIELEDAGWKGSAGTRTSLQHDAPQRAFYESLMANTGAGLNPCVAIMRLDGKPIAINLCTRTGNTLWMLKITYADDLQEHSPGNLILLYLLDHFAEVPDIEYISFITGGEWTWRWGPEKQPVLFCSLFNKSLLGIAGAALEHARDKLRRVKRQLKSALKAPPKSSDRQEDAT